MSLYVDVKYVSLIGLKLDRFKQKGQYLWNFRCVVCKDSKKSKIKARGYLYRAKSGIYFKCHNCHAAMGLGPLIKSLDPHLYQQYQLDTFAEKPRPTRDVEAERMREHIKQLNVRRSIALPSIADLPIDHFARKYVADRKIPVVMWQDLYYAEDFKKFAIATFSQERLEEKGLIDDDKRLVIPFFDTNKALLGCQGRTLSNSKIRYITIKAVEESSKLFGLDRLNFNKRIYVFEGPIDSMFLPNAIATMDSALYRVADALGRQHDYVFCYDNQPRNKQVARMIEKTIEMGYKVCLLPDTGDGKDVNDLVLAGVDVQSYIDQHTYQGLQAKLEFQLWRK